MRIGGLTSWWRQQLADLTTDRARIMLVTLGIVWGTLSLTIVVAFGSGFGEAMGRSMRASGDHILRLRPGGTTKPFEGLPPGRTIMFRFEDADAILQGVPAVTAVSVEYSSSSNPMVYDGRRRNARVQGVQPSFGPLRTFRPRPGSRSSSPAPTASGARSRSRFRPEGTTRWGRTSSTTASTTSW